jgi:AraC family transcriptional regulator of arabinose operon
MPPRKETHQPAEGLHAGEFRSNRAYTNWRPRGTRDWLLIHTVAGAGYMTTATGEGATRPGDVTLYAPGEMQDYKTDPSAGHWHLLWIHFLPRPSWQPWLRWSAGTHGVRSLHLEKGATRDHFQSALHRMIQIQRRKLPVASDLAFNALEEALLWTRVAASREDSRVRRAMDYLVAHLREPFRLEITARHCGLSSSRLAHLFKAETGLSLQQFFEAQRMAQAEQLLRLTSLGVAEIAAETGYDDPFYFSNRFRRHSRKSPSQFRRLSERR